MTLKELQFFYKLCENQKVTQIAKEMGISQSAISIAIKSLENKLGEILFDRIGKKLVLNERGRLFYKETYKHYIALVDAKHLFQKEKLSGILNIGSSKTIASYIMPEIYYDFLSTYKGVTLNTSTINSTIIIQKVLSGELDIGLIETTCNERDLIKDKLLDDELILVTSDNQAPTKEYIDKIDKKWILRESGSGTKEIFFNELGELTKELRIFMELDEIDEIKKLLLRYKDTISVLSKTVVVDEIKNQKLFEVKLINLAFKREFSLIYHKNKTQNILFKTFIDFLKQSFDNIS